jgi:hypothetical protein
VPHAARLLVALQQIGEHCADLHHHIPLELLEAHRGNGRPFRPQLEVSHSELDGQAAAVLDTIWTMEPQREL